VVLVAFQSGRRWGVVGCKGSSAYLGASFVPFALEWTGSQIGGRRTTLRRGLLEGLVCHGGRAGGMPSTAFLG